MKPRIERAAEIVSDMIAEGVSEKTAYGALRLAIFSEGVLDLIELWDEAPDEAEQHEVLKAIIESLESWKEEDDNFRL